MLNLISLAVLLSSLLLFSELNAENLSTRLNSIYKLEDASLVVESSARVYDYNSEVLLKPASLMKIASVSYLLKVLDPKKSASFEADFQAILTSSDNNKLNNIFEKSNITLPLVNLSQYLKGFTQTEIKVADLSGKSHENRINCDLLIKLLNTNRNNPAFKKLLAEPGTGTLSERKNLPNTLQAKTGSIRGVRALAGYIISNSNNNLTFCMINNQVKNDSEAIQIEDRVVQSLWELG